MTRTEIRILAQSNGLGAEEALKKTVHIAGELYTALRDLTLNLPLCVGPGTKCSRCDAVVEAALATLNRAVK